jgi:2-polyprenyl-6-methoxyphenol hydroxylase-like FAD-dependent oxidoreductase
MASTDYDVIIAGGGIAGVAAAAAVREFGWSVLIVEPTVQSERRLAGELIHPRGVAALIELGLCGGERFEGAVPIKGFVAFTGPETSHAQIALPYAARGDFESGLALDHGRIRASLQACAAALPHVTMLYGSRIAGLENQGATTAVTVTEGGMTRELRCRLVVAADGAGSAVRGFAGISHTRRPTATITGYVISDRNLPAPGFGHVFIGSSAPLLAYEIGGGRARVLFDQPINQAYVIPEEHRARIIKSVSHGPLREEITEAVAAQTGLSFNTADLVVERATAGHVALLGDAGGSCHPLTATGMTIGLSDALRLRGAFRDSCGNIQQGLKHYGARRRAAQRTRLLVASALHDALSGQSSESRLLRVGLIRYWSRGARGRRASMAILAMSNSRFVGACWEMFVVMLHGLMPPLRAWSLLRAPTALRLVPGLFGVVVRQMSFAVRAR